MMAVNSSVSESTCYPPSFQTQGREPTALHDREILGTGRHAESPEGSVKKFKEVFEIGRRNLEKAAQALQSATEKVEF